MIFPVSKSSINASAPMGIRYSKKKLSVITDSQV